MKKLGHLLVVLFAVFVVHQIEGGDIKGTHVRFGDNGVFVYDSGKKLNHYKNSGEKIAAEQAKNSGLKAYVPNENIQAVEVK